MAAEQRTKRFKHKSYKQALKDVHLPSSLHQKHLENYVEGNDSIFHSGLEHWRQLNLAPSFLSFAKKVGPLCLSMPLLLHNWREVLDLWIEAIGVADDEGLKALLDLLQKLLADLRATVLPAYHTVLSILLSLLPRGIETEAFSVLLSTLADFFKYLLVPQTDVKLLKDTWKSLCSTLEKCLPEVQRAAADVWGALLRRLKGNEIKEKAMVLLAENLEGLESVGATALVYACKSVSQTLHTCTPTLFKPLLVHHLTNSPSPELTHKLIRRSLTALIHHVKSAEQFSSLAELLVGQFDLTLQRYNEKDSSFPSSHSVPLDEQLRRALELIAVPCSVRQGSRLGHPSLQQLFTCLNLLPLKVANSSPAGTGSYHSALLRFTVALYIASDMALWLGPGRDFLQRSWDEAASTYLKQFPRGDIEMEPNSSSEQQPSHPKWTIYAYFTLPLHASLAELSWGGWKLVALPPVLKHTLQLFNKVFNDGEDERTSKTLVTFLATLRRAKKLNPSEVDVVWRERLQRWSLQRIRRLGMREGETGSTWPEEEAAELNEILSLSPFFSAEFPAVIAELVNGAFSGPTVVPHANLAWVIGRCLQMLANCDSNVWPSNVDVASWTLKASTDWSWSPDVLQGLVDVSQVKSSQPASINLGHIYPSLKKSLMSHCHPLRLAVLRLLDSHLVISPKNARDIIKRCLNGEEAPLDVQGVRERVVCISRVVQIVADEEGADISVRWLIAQLKVNLRSVWSPTAAAIASLSQNFGELIWRLLFEELKAAALESPETEKEDSRLLTWTENGPSQSEGGDPWEEERTWRDPSAHKLRSVVARWINNPDFLVEGLRQSLPKRERFDAQSYEAQLLTSLGQCPSLAERHNREFVSFFLSLASGSGVGPGITEDEAPLVLVPKLLHRPKLIAYLKLFSKFANPKALYATEALKSLYTTLLSHPDHSLQSVAFSCLLKYKSSVLLSYEAKLLSLLDDTRWRDELTTFDIEALEQTDRKEVVAVLTRLLFGRMLEKRGRARGADRRAAVLATLAALDEDELGLLVELMVKPLGPDTSAAVDIDLHEARAKIGLVDFDEVPEKQQIGFLTLLGDVLKNLGPRLVQYWPLLIELVVGLVGHAHGKVTALGTSEEMEELHEDPGHLDSKLEDENEEDDASPSPHTVKLYRSIRQLGLKRFADFFKSPVHFDFSTFLRSSFATFISPRLALLDKENTQAPSALLELFFAWTRDPAYVRYLVAYDLRTLPKVYDCLIATNVKPAVVSRVFDIAERILDYSTTTEEIREQVLRPHVALLLTNLSILVERTNVAAVSTPLGQRQINILCSVAQYLTDEKQASLLIRLLIPLLRKPTKNVPERVKADVVKILGESMPLVPELRNPASEIYEKVYASLSLLFQSLRSRPGRNAVVSTFHRLADLNHPLASLASLLESLNAYSSKRIEEPDFDRRLVAFADLNENLYKTLVAADWLPVLYNSLFFIQDHEELAIRHNASLAMRRFIESVACQSSAGFEQIFLRILFPGLKHGLRSKNELVRAEILGVLAYAVARCDQIGILKDMEVLLAGGDEEASFFNNILHVQLHRRTRALRRLADLCKDGCLRSSLLADIFVPLVENFIISSAAVDHHLVNHAIHAIGHMAYRLSWGPYYALVQKYIKLSKSKDESERMYIRTLVAILDNFHFSMDEEVPAPEAEVNVLEDEEKDESGDTALEGTQQVTPGIQRAEARIADAVNKRLLPTLLDHLEKHDPTTDDNARLPVSIGIVNVAKHLPPSTRDSQITRLLTIISQILRSHSQETRDLAREALQRIAVILGSSYLPRIMRELRGALVRGPQLHVLAFVVHALLAYITSGEHAQHFESLDHCVDDIAYVSAEVIFGESGKDVQAEDFKTKIREVRSSTSKGYDSFAITARFVTPSRISGLLTPLRAILHETESAKVMGSVDEVLKRIASGLNSNKHLASKDLIVLCHTLITQNAKFLQQVPSRRKIKEKNDVIVQMKRNAGTETDHYANNSYRFVAFGLDLLHTALRRTRFDFRDADVMNRLNSMIVAVGNTLYSTSTPVLVLGLKCTSGLVKCPLSSLPMSLPVFVSQALDIIKRTGNTEAEVVQMALKTLATILREGPPVQIKEKDLVYLLELLAPDIEEPSKQISVFAMLRAIVARKLVVPEIYDIMGKVSEVMVTSQSTQVQELCRGVLLQFLLDYPQGKGRLRTQMAFLAKNLSYVYESGRKSVMELLNAVIAKFQPDLIREYSDLLFIALVMVIANDDSAKCREMAAQLIKALFVKLDDSRKRVLFSHLHSWAAQRDRPSLSRISSQVYGFIVEALQSDVHPYVNLILEDLRAALANAARQWEHDEEDNAIQVDVEWQIPYHSLSVLFKVARTVPDFDVTGDQIPWGLVVTYLVFPHAWVRTASSRMLGLLFNAIPVAAPRLDLPEAHPLSAVGMREVADKTCLQLKSENLDEPLGLQVVKNLFFIGKCFNCLPMNESAGEDEEDINMNGTADDKVEPEERKRNDPLPWLFTKLSYQLRSAYLIRRSKAENSANWHQQPLAVLRWFAATASHVDASRLECFLVQIISPVYRLIEDDTIHDPRMDEIKILAVELQDLVQTKVGVVKFSAVYNRIRQSVLNIRRERKVARTLQITTNPETAARRKLQRNISKKMSKKRKDQTFADGKRVKKRRVE